MSTIQLYNHTISRFVTGANAAADTYKVMLLSDSATFDATHTTLSQVTNAGANQVSGNGWTAGGVTLANVTLALANTSGAKFDADDISVTATGGSIGPYSHYVIFNDTDADDPPVGLVTLTAPATITVGQALEIHWSSNGIVSFAQG